MIVVPTASVIVSAYDIPFSLRLAMLGYQRQSCKDFELIVADDGSGSETADLVKQFQRTSDFTIKHIWRENKGYWMSRIINEGVKASIGQCLILTNGDCIPHPDFVKSHIDAYKQGSFCTGAYVLMPYEYCVGLTDEKVMSGDYERFLTMWKMARLTFRHWRNTLHIAMKRARYPKINGRNISIDRNTFYAVNGYDENYHGLGGVDPDLRNRLLQYGANPISLWNKSVVFHIDHKAEPTRKSHPPRDREKSLEYRHRSNIPVRCENGLVKEGSYKENK